MKEESTKRITIRDIAEVCRVSLATVSKALNGSPDIGSETVERIRRTADAMGYRPNAAARTLKTNRSNNIGVLFEDDTHVGLTHEYFVHVLNAVKSSAESRGYDVTFLGRTLGGRDVGYRDHCLWRGCDGVVIANVDFSEPSVLDLIESSIPVVTIDHVFPDHSAVISDNEQGMMDLTTYVIGQGHRDIAFICGEKTDVTDARVRGFREAMNRAGLPVREDWILDGRYHSGDISQKHTETLLSGSVRPTCILYPDDISLLGGLYAIEQAGLRVPEDVSVTGYDGIPLSRIMHPIITTLRQDSSALGEQAASLLIHQIEEGDSFTRRRVIIPGQVQVGETVRKLDL